MKDTGLNLNDIPIVIVHNGLHHFVGAHYPQPTFKHGILDICQHLQQARFIADSLKVKDEAVHGVVTTTAKTVATLAYNLERLSNPLLVMSLQLLLQPENKGHSTLQRELDTILMMETS